MTSANGSSTQRGGTMEEHLADTWEHLEKLSWPRRDRRSLQSVAKPGCLLVSNNAKESILDEKWFNSKKTGKWGNQSKGGAKPRARMIDSRGPQRQRPKRWMPSKKEGKMASEDWTRVMKCHQNRLFHPEFGLGYWVQTGDAMADMVVDSYHVESTLKGFS